MSLEQEEEPCIYLIMVPGTGPAPQGQERATQLPGPQQTETNQSHGDQWLQMLSEGQKSQQSGRPLTRGFVCFGGGQGGLPGGSDS